MRQTVGFQGSVTQSNSLVLGNNVKVGIGTSAPLYKLHVVGENVRVEGNSPSISPRFSLNFTGGAVDGKRWQNYATTNTLNFSAMNDAENGETFWLQVSRGTGTAIASVIFPSGNVAIGIGAAPDKLGVNGTISLATLGAAGDTSLCRNGSNQISTCTAGNLTERSGGENAVALNALREQLKRQQLVIDELKQIVCTLKPDAAVCKEIIK